MYILYYMNQDLREKLILIAREKIGDDDPSHDFNHAMRVLKNAEYIAKKEKADLDIIIPAALFHDIIVYRKSGPKSHLSSDHSAELAEVLLLKIKEYPKKKIQKVKLCIVECSFSKGIIPNLLESKIIQDSDLLESTGIISIMRTFASSGSMQRPFYNEKDPFCKNREPNAKEYALDLFYARLLKVESRIHTKTAKKIAKKRTKFLYVFLNEFEKELKGF